MISVSPNPVILTSGESGQAGIPHTEQLVCEPDDGEWGFVGVTTRIFSVDENGLVTGLNPGNGIITCYHGDDEVEVRVYVDMMPAG